MRALSLKNVISFGTPYTFFAGKRGLLLNQDHKSNPDPLYRRFRIGHSFLPPLDAYNDYREIYRRPVKKIGYHTRICDTWLALIT